MKCPKCGYLGFEAVDRCRNCGYDFSLMPSLALPELPIRETAAEGNPTDDLSLVDAAVSEANGPLPSVGRHSELPLFGEEEDDVPLISTVRPPRPPLSVRRATADVPRVRASAPPRTPMLDLGPSEPFAALPAPTRHPRGEERAMPAPDEVAWAAPLGARFLAAIVDLVILAIVDTVVVYFTMEICGLDFSEIALLPKGPLLAFLLVQNGGYLIAFTAGGQTLGKMMAGIKVVPVQSNVAMDVGQAAVRTLVWAALAVPAGLGFLTTLMSGDRRGLHDRLAGTKVVRASA